MNTIKVKNTYNINISGTPSEEVAKLGAVTTLAVNPSSIAGIKPKLLVKEGDTVQIGTPLFFDKQDDRIQFLSPGAGTIKSITYGPKRRIDEVIIAVSGSEDSVDLGAKTDGLTKEIVTEKLLKGGLWGSLSAYPFQIIPSPDATPPAIYVSLDYDEPFMPAASVYLKQYEAEIQLGLAALKTLTDTLVVSCSASNPLKTKIKGITHQIEGNYPANNPGVVLYHNKKTAEENKSWGIQALDLIRIGQLLSTGKYPTERLVVVAGSLASKPQHVLAREGVAIKELLATQTASSEPTRYIAGGVMTGRSSSETGYLGYADYALHLIREGKAPEMFTFFRPGFDKPTASKTYLSALLNKTDWEMNTSLNGGERSCISCAACPDVCPVDLFPQFIMKSLHANDYEEAIKQGFLDCVSCGLCTYVCPSKIDLDDIFSDARAKIAKEV